MNILSSECVMCDTTVKHNVLLSIPPRHQDIETPRNMTFQMAMGMLISELCTIEGKLIVLFHCYSGQKSLVVVKLFGLFDSGLCVCLLVVQ